jgi:hypothetical protein
MVFNLNILDLILLLHHEINHTLYKKITLTKNYLQFHYVQNSSDKNYKIR